MFTHPNSTTLISGIHVTLSKTHLTDARYIDMTWPINMAAAKAFIKDVTGHEMQDDRLVFEHVIRSVQS